MNIFAENVAFCWNIKGGNVATPAPSLLFGFLLGPLGRLCDYVVDLTEYLLSGRLIPIEPEEIDVPGLKFIPAHLLYLFIIEVDTLKNHATCSIPLMSFSYSTEGDLRRMSAPEVEAMVRVWVASSYDAAEVAPLITVLPAATMRGP